MSCKAAEDEIFICLDDGKSPSFLVAASMEIFSLPTISLGVVNSGEFCLRKNVSYELRNHLPMGVCSQILRTAEIFLRIVYLCRLVLRDWLRWSRDRYRRGLFFLILLILEISLGLVEFLNERSLFLLLSSEFFGPCDFFSIEFF